MKSKIEYHNTFLSNHDFLKKNFKSKKSKYNINLFNFLKKVNKIKFPKNEFSLKESKRHKIAEMATNPIILNFYKFLLNSFNPKRILEIGSFIGYSTLYFAKYSSKNARITTIEKFSEFSNICLYNFKRNKLNKKINLINQDASLALDKLIKKKKKYDFVFLDGDKGKYKELFMKVEKLISKKSIVIVDNVFFQGDLINKNPLTVKGKGVKKFINYVTNNKKFSVNILPMYDGIALIKKN
tara:strand:- start:443 stop:1162 length:720 start_codon:yes stop_codon:yes gene_type:complete